MLRAHSASSETPSTSKTRTIRSRLRPRSILRTRDRITGGFSEKGIRTPTRISLRVVWTPSQPFWPVSRGVDKIDCPIPGGRPREPLLGRLGRLGQSEACEARECDDTLTAFNQVTMLLRQLSLAWRGTLSLRRVGEAGSRSAWPHSSPWRDVTIQGIQELVVSEHVDPEVHSFKAEKPDMTTQSSRTSSPQDYQGNERRTGIRRYMDNTR